ncbi:MAG: FecR domain-containing protein [Melioribacter sp.]|nr:FecR domain-containing protein [Melioribacter sp.]
MNCKEIKILLHDYVDELLDDDTRKLILKHIKSCNECRKAYYRLTSFFDLLKDIPYSVEPPKEILEELSNTLLEKSLKESRVELKEEFSKKSIIKKEQVTQENILKSTRGPVRKSIITHNLVSTISRKSLLSIKVKWTKLILMSLVLLFLGIGFLVYELSLDNSPWKIKTMDGEYLINGKKDFERFWYKGTSLRTAEKSKIKVYVPNSSTIEIYPNSELFLLKTKKNDNRIKLINGKIKVSSNSLIPYFSVYLDEATIDFKGGSFVAKVDKNFNVEVLVESGLVEIEKGDESCLVDEGYICKLKSNYRLGIPYRLGANDSLKNEIEKFDYMNSNNNSIERIIKYSKAEDALTLLYLIPNTSVVNRGQLFQKIANYFPPPSNVTYEGIIKLNKEMLKSWGLEIEWQL